MEQNIEEARLYGSHWNVVHSGYFADPAISRPFVKAIARTIEDQHTKLVADLGGGTGYILEELLRERPYPGIRFIDVDSSGDQTSACNNPMVESLNLNVTEITREHFSIEHDNVMFIMRSVLHYLGEDGLRPFLKHLRAQMRKGEMFVHQTACFEDAEHAACLNHLYYLMKTQKWYPTVKELIQILISEGFYVEEFFPAPKLVLKANELAERYHLGENEIISIGAEMMHRFGETPDVFVKIPEGYAAYLHYMIFICRAV